MTGYEPMIVKRDWNRVTDREWADVLAKLPLFSQLDKRHLRKLAADSEFAEFSAGDTVVLTGAPADSFFVILSGKARARGKSAARDLGAGDYFGEMGLLDDQPRSATIVATDELHVMRVPRRQFLALVEQNAAVAHTLLKELGERVRRLESSS